MGGRSIRALGKVKNRKVEIENRREGGNVGGERKCGKKKAPMRNDRTERQRETEREKEREREGGKEREKESKITAD